MGNKLFSGLMLLLIIPFVLAQTQMFGGETDNVYENNTISCFSVGVEVNSTENIEFNTGGLREYDLIGCGFQNNFSLRHDNWSCNCSGIGFNLTLSTLQNTINTYTFNLTFFNETEDGNGISQVSILGGGGGGRGSCITQWNCTEWSGCINGTQTRICSYPENFCEPKSEKPAEIQSCTIPEEDEIIEDEEISQGFFAGITGAVVGALGTGGTIVALIFVILIIGGAVIVIVKTKNTGGFDKSHRLQRQS
jgi:hypothetical protein